MSDVNFEDKVIGANVRRFRETYGISRDNLAEIFHVSNDGVYRIERGETGLSSAYAYILANELHCDMNFIYGTAPEPTLINMPEIEAHMVTPKQIANRLRMYADILDELEEYKRK